ncbi:uncharacterized protein LOC131310770 [Rhododendron vialii]|uniref:uncharacterized protein LOC131310770 n=1 Tax=Rhododendron vialii TaxID=182163 RepID=UPI00266053B1|nr:uncharacterized protein LOC131310770 [Rhododendron vialii]
MMDGRGGCCIAPYAAGVYDMSKVDRIMLRYRPIAPKPAAGGSVSGGSSPENSEANASSGRGKRKYVKQRGKKSSNKGCRKYSNKRRKSSSDKTETGQNSSSTGGSVSGGDPAVTLPLLPETPDRRDSPARGSPSERHTIWLNFSNNDNSNRKMNDNREAFDVGRVSSWLDRTVVTTPQPTRLVGSIVTVESVADTWVDAYGLGWKDEERMRSLEEDTCPGFVSDGYNRVGWTNEAYREMVGGEVVVWLVMKERVPITYPAFTCKVKVQYTCGKERCSVVVPCDAWKMDGGGFAWRLDVKAALSLGR